jgi:hypothetical protein
MTGQLNPAAAAAAAGAAAPVPEPVVMIAYRVGVTLPLENLEISEQMGVIFLS